jgi:hypothetical protein
MSTGPTRLILIRSGLFEYAEVEMKGALQIVGPNNTGKTTLINTLQFLFLNDRRHMDFGSYSPEQTRAFYFPSQYSYLLFECLGASGHCLLGWRGQSKTSGGEPERFAHLGPFDPSDFLDEKNQVREPRDVNARLALKQFRALKTADEHRELLLPPVGTNARGFGIVALRDPDKYHQFRETLKNLLTLSAITQDQMRDRLLMLADIPPQRTAFDARDLFGEDYDRIRARRERLVTFKDKQHLVETLVDRFTERELIRAELIFRWTDLRAKCQSFQQEHEIRRNEWRQQAALQADRLREIESEMADRREEIAAFSRQEGALTASLNQLARLDDEFGGFTEEFERTALKGMQREISLLERQLAEAQGESREKIKAKLDLYSGLVQHQEQTIARFDHLAVTALRKHLGDDELKILFRLLNRDLLELPVGPEGVTIQRENDLLQGLNSLLQRVHDNVYADANVSLPLPRRSDPLLGLANPDAAREQLADHRSNLQRLQLLLAAIEQREKLESDLQRRRGECETKSRLLYRFEEYQKTKAEEPRVRAELKQITEAIQAAADRISKLSAQGKTAEKTQRQAEAAITSEENAFNAVMGRFNQCLFPEFSAKPAAVDNIPNDFDAAISLFLRQQEKQETLSIGIAQLLTETERWFGEEFRGHDERATVALLREELEALAEKEEALARDWNAHLHGLKATFDLVLKNMGHVASAADELNRALARVTVSNLKAIKLQVIGQSDLMSWIKRLAAFEPGGLFDRDPEQESAISNFRRKLESNPLIRFADLFTLGVTVTGADDRRHTYHDFRQIESHGTTITIKVLFNLLLLKNQLRHDDCAVPFFLDEIQTLDPANRQAILTTARQLGFIAITAAPEAVSEVDALYFLQPQNGKIILRNRHRIGIKRPASASLTSPDA